MALKAKLAKAEFEALAEVLKEHYKASGEDYILDAEGVEDVSGLKSALEKEKRERRELKTKLEAEAERFKDLDPERAREALKTLAELDDKKLVDKGEFDRLLKKRSDEFDQREAEYQNQLREAQSRLDTYELINPVKDAALKAGIIPKKLEMVMSYAGKRFKLNDKRKPVVLDADGDETSHTLDEFWSKEFKDEWPEFYAGTGAGGSGANPNHNGGKSGVKSIARKDLETMNPNQAMTLMKQVKAGEVTLTD